MMIVEQTRSHDTLVRIAQSSGFTVAGRYEGRICDDDDDDAQELTVDNKP
jgi:hypothetical protein